MTHYARKASTHFNAAKDMGAATGPQTEVRFGDVPAFPPGPHGVGPPVQRDQPTSPLRSGSAHGAPGAANDIFVTVITSGRVVPL
jgi:hypothetical protein